jgi:glycosyltransferase involved in cell wall biosynthesis
MRRVLMVAYYFPPLGGIGSLRAVKFATYLPEFGWEPTVLAPRDGAYYRDPSLTFPEERVIRTSSFEVSRLGKRAVGAGGTDTEAAAVGPTLGQVRRFVRRWIYHPDAQVGWYPFAVAAGRRALRDVRFDAIFSSSFPITAHLVARRLHRDHGVPWVAEFRDPWADVPPDAKSGDRRDRLERALLRDADAVVTVSPSWRDRFLEKGPRRVEIVTNGFDAADLPAASPSDDYVVTHLGSFYPRMQDLSAVWEALKKIRAQEPGLRLRVRFVGEIAVEVRDEIAAYGLSDVLEVTGFLSHRAALAATMASSLLVAAGFRREDPLYEGWIPAKLFEYLGTGLPIVYMGAASTDAARLLAEQAACRVIAPGDVESVLAAFLEFRRQGRIHRDLAPYARRALAGQLGEIFASVRR